MDKLLETCTKFKETQIWNDSCSREELKYAIERGAVGATTNPVIVLQVLQQELADWEGDILKTIQNHPNYSEDDVAWETIKKMGLEASKLLLPIYHKNKGLKGRLSLQTNAKFFNNKDKLVQHAIELASIAENTQIKAPTSKAGVEAFEELTYRGISINATVSFTVSQALAVAEAVERGLNRRQAEGLSIDQMNPVCTIMIGRVDDYLKTVLAKGNQLIDPDALEFAGVAVFKNAYKIYKQRKYRTKLLVAAYRNHYHWSSLIGGELIHTIPYKWQLKYNVSDIEVRNTIEEPVSEHIMIELMKMPEFVKAYDENGLKPEEFEKYGAFIVTMNQFLDGYDQLIKLIRPYFWK